MENLGLNKTMSSRALDISSRLHQAIGSRCIEFHYQPEVDTQIGRIVGFEVLSRWNDDVLGIVNPEEFIACATERGWLEELTASQIEIIGKDLPLIDASFPKVAVAFNLPPSLINNANLIDLLKGLSENRPLNQSSIEVELTETAASGPDSEWLEGLYKIKELGMQIAMDDFGSCHSSINRFCKFQFDRIKLDSAVTQQVGSPIGRAAIKMLVQMTNELNVAFTVEGVETKTQLEQLQELGCTRFQGWHFSKALSLNELLKLTKII